MKRIRCGRCTVQCRDASRSRAALGGDRFGIAYRLLSSGDLEIIYFSLEFACAGKTYCRQCILRDEQQHVVGLAGGFAYSARKWVRVDEIGDL
jgi:hypothetical protein